MFKRYREIDSEYLKTDFHLHSTYTDGKNTMEEMVKRAKDLGLSAIAFTDHTRENSTYFPEYFKEIELLQEKYSITIYKGIEARISDFKGNISYPQRIKGALDIIVASVHRVTIDDKLYSLDIFTKKYAMEFEKLLCLEAVARGGFNVLGHCGGMSIHFYEQFPLEYFEEIIQACSKNNIAFEINSRYHASYKEELNTLLKKYNPLVSYGSDAHAIDAIRGYYENV